MSDSIMDIGVQLAQAATQRIAQETGRTVEEQVARMGDHYAYMGVEQNPNQRQLDDYH